MRPQAGSQRFQVDTAAVDGVQLVTVLFQMGRKDIVDVAGNADSRCYHGKQGAHPFIVLAADIGLPALFHNVVAEQMFGILLKAVLFPVCFLPKNHPASWKVQAERLPHRRTHRNRELLPCRIWQESRTDFPFPVSCHLLFGSQQRCSHNDFPGQRREYPRPLRGVSAPHRF